MLNKWKESLNKTSFNLNLKTRERFGDDLHRIYRKKGVAHTIKT